MSSKKTKRPGRPRSAHTQRSAIRHDPNDLPIWKVAAATCGLTLADWILHTLRAEAKRATHVPRLRP